MGARRPARGTGGTDNESRRGVVSVSVSAVGANGDDFDSAKRVYKWLRSGRVGVDELNPHDFGLLVIYFPDVAAKLLPEEFVDE